MTDKKSNPLSELARSVSLSRWAVLSAIVGSIAAYTIYFGFVEGAPLSGQTDSWGQFGDFVGGILNPVIAFFAFYWLSQSVLIQKEELADTKTALQKSAEAQSEQGRQAAISAKINALNTLLTSYDNDVSNIRSNVEFVSSQLSQYPVWLMSGAAVGEQDAKLHIGELNKSLVNMLEKREKIRDQISHLLNRAEA